MELSEKSKYQESILSHSESQYRNIVRIMKENCDKNLSVNCIIHLLMTYTLGGEIMILHVNWKKLIISLLIPFAVGGLTAFLTRSDMEFYSTLDRPPLSPPGWLFPIVWGILYFLMGISLYLVWTSRARNHEKRAAFTIFGLQLFMNFLWSPVFFSMRRFLLAFIILVILWIFIIAMIIIFKRISRPAGLLQIPYLLWVTFAGYLNLGIYFLNR